QRRFWGAMSHLSVMVSLHGNQGPRTRALSDKRCEKKRKLLTNGSDTPVWLSFSPCACAAAHDTGVKEKTREDRDAAVISPRRKASRTSSSLYASSKER